MAVWIVAAGAALVLGGVGIGAVVASRPKTDASSASSTMRAPDPTQAVTTTSAEQGSPAAAGKSSDPPTISVGDLPGAKAAAGGTNSTASAGASGAAGAAGTTGGATGAAGAAGAAGATGATGASSAYGPIAKDQGRLNVAAPPGGCAIAIDGKDRGQTPIAAIDLPAGQHQVQCKPSSGKSRSATVTVTDGATSKYRFALDD